MQNKFGGKLHNSVLWKSAEYYPIESSQLTAYMTSWYIYIYNIYNIHILYITCIHTVATCIIMYIHVQYVY